MRSLNQMINASDAARYGPGLRGCISRTQGPDRPKRLIRSSLRLLQLRQRSFSKRETRLDEYLELFDPSVILMPPLFCWPDYAVKRTRD